MNLEDLMDQREEFEKYFSAKMLKSATDELNLAKYFSRQELESSTVKVTKWAMFKAGINHRFWEFRRWLSHKIFPWDDYN